MKRSKLRMVTLACFVLLLNVRPLSLGFASPLVRESTGSVPPPEGTGPYLVGWLDTNINKTGGGLLPISIYYPSLTSGQDSQPNTTLAPYPTLLFSPGWQSTIDTYRSLASTISSWGFVFALAGTTPGAWSAERASDVVDMLNWIDDQNDNASFVLNGMIDKTKFGVMGHSLGGEAALLVARSDLRIKVTAPIAPYTGDYGLTPNIHFPLFIIVGSDDTIAPTATMAYPLYDHGNSPKFCVTLMGQNHLSIILTCSRYIVQFLEFSLYENDDYATYLYGFDAQKEVQDGTIRLSYDLRKTVNYEVVSGQTSYNVSVYSDSTFLGFLYNETKNELNFTLKGPPDTTGTANISIPTPLVQNKDIAVYYDRKEYSFVLSFGVLCHFVYVAYNHSEHELTIDLVDLTPPILSVISPSFGSITRSSTVEVEWNAEDSASGVDYCLVKADEHEWINVGNAMSFIFSGLNDGNHTTYVKAFDKAGNAREASVSFVVDTTAPLVSLVSPVNGSIMNYSSITVTWTVEDFLSGVKHIELSVDEGGQFVDVSNVTSLTLQGLHDGEHEVLVKAYDIAGNMKEVYIDFVVDTLPPNVSILLPMSGSKINSSDVTVTWNGVDNVSGIDHFEAKLDDGMWMGLGIVTSLTFTGLTNGNHTGYIRAVDKAGLLSERQVAFEVDMPLASLWMQWWFWAILAGIVALVMTALASSFMRRSFRSRRA